MRVLGISLADAPGIEPGTSCEASPLTGLSYASGDLAGVQIFELALIHLRILEKNVERRGHRSVKSASAVGKAAAQYIEVEEAPQRMGDHSNRGKRRRIGFGGRETSSCNARAASTLGRAPSWTTRQCDLTTFF